MLAPMPTRQKKPRRPLAETVPDVVLAVLGVAGLVLSGWSLGTLMHDTAGAPWLVAVFAVAVFDLVALAAGVLVYGRRRDPWAAAGARAVMTLALAASSVVNGAHGYALGGWTTAAVLAAAPVAFEVVFELRHRTLTGLVWILFRREAFNRLKADAWQRIAVEVEGGRVTAVSGSPEDIARTVRGLQGAQTASELPSGADPDPVRTHGSGSGLADPPRSGSGSLKDRVRALYESGTTDPAALVRALPDANPETIKRHVRTVRTEGGYA
ncbi:hypothetical protein [Streptomyces sp. NPDC058739]|uniref:hypothetical protein n=1 Tax=Streptomyces sp. NPDC058739 TaxID=3346618 RepID=UPI0036AA430E